MRFLKLFACISAVLLGGALGFAGPASMPASPLYAVVFVVGVLVFFALLAGCVVLAARWRREVAARR